MKCFLLFLILTVSTSAQLKPINEEIYNKLNNYRLSKYKLTLTTPQSAGAVEKYKKALDKLPSPKHNLAKYIWGLSKKNKEYSEKQLEDIQKIILKYRPLRSRLHDERNYCRIRMLIDSYSFSIAKKEDKSDLEKRIKLWLQLWLNYKSDEEEVAYRFAEEIWQWFSQEQQQKLLNGEISIKSAKSGHKRNFSGENQLKKVFKISKKNSQDLAVTLKQLEREYSELQKKFLKSQDDYNKSYFYIDSLSGEYAVSNAAKMNKLLSDIYWFHTEAMKRLMSEIVISTNRDSVESKLKTFIENFYTNSYEKYYLKGNGKGLIDLATH